jgi:hypothetical protein
MCARPRETVRALPARALKQLAPGPDYVVSLALRGAGRIALPMDQQWRLATERRHLRSCGTWILKLRSLGGQPWVQLGDGKHVDGIGWQHDRRRGAKYDLVARPDCCLVEFVSNFGPPRERNSERRGLRSVCFHGKRAATHEATWRLGRDPTGSLRSQLRLLQSAVSLHGVKWE